MTVGMEKTLEHKVNYQKIFDALPLIFLVLKPDAPNFTILEANQVFLEQGHLKREDVLNRGLFDVLSNDTAAETALAVVNLKRSLQKVLGSRMADHEPIQRYDLRNAVTGSMEERYWLAKNTPVLDPNGEIQYIVHYVEDVTEMTISEKQQKAEAGKAADEILKKSMLIKENEDRINKILNVLLKYTVMDFSEKLWISPKGDELDAIAMGLNTLINELDDHVEKLTRSNRELELVNKELDSFSYSVSHDLRAPLRAIDGYSRMIIEDYGDKIQEEGKHYLQTVIRNAERMGALIDDLLSFSRIGKQSVTSVLLNMSSITEAVVSELRQLPYRTDTQIIIKPLLPVHGDSSMIRRTMANLVSNAVKYSQKTEKPVVEIGCQKEPDKIIYYVKDNGVGFDMKYYDKLFGVFQRLHGKNEFEGTGVGLALVHRIIQKHRGEVWAEGKTGEGASFYFSLPINNLSNNAKL